MKSEYFTLLVPIDICCSLQSLGAIALKMKKLWRKVGHSSMRLYYDGSQLKSSKYHLQNKDLHISRFNIINWGSPTGLY